jgi:hypothetical protein
MQDVDVLVLDRQDDGSHYDPEDIKRWMVEENPRFYLVDALTPGAHWKKLRYHLGGEGLTRRPSAIKIDVLVPGAMELPSFDRRNIYRRFSELPIAPLSLVLLHKVRGWLERSTSDVPYQWEKHRQDASDVASLLPIASEGGVNIKSGVLPDEFLESAGGWVGAFINKYPNFPTHYWQTIGFTLV